MTHLMIRMFAIAGDFPAGAIKPDAGTLKTLEIQDPGSTGFELLDNSIGSVSASDSALVRIGSTLKLLKNDGSFLEQDAPGAVRFAADLGDGPVRQALAGLPPLRSLQVVFAGPLIDQAFALVDDEGKTHCRIQLQKVLGDDGTAIATLATVRGLRGYDKAFNAVVAGLTSSDGRTDEPLGALYSRLVPDRQSYNPKPEIDVSKNEPAFETANEIIATYINTARQNEQGVVEDRDTEYLHDYRVCLRKVRSVVSLFKGVYAEEQTAELKQVFSELMNPTGRLRDLDVYLLERQHYYDLLPETLHPGLTAMFRSFERERARQLKKLSAHLTGTSYQTEIGYLQRLFAGSDGLRKGTSADRSAYDYACELIWKRYRKVCKIAREIGAHTDDEEVHELRIHCKKLRYLMEFFAPVFHKADFKFLIKPLKELQDNLGLFNDYSVQQVSLQDFLTANATRGRPQDVAIAQSIGALTVVLHQRQTDERARVVSSFAHFDSPAVQSKFRELFDRKGD